MPGGLAFGPDDVAFLFIPEEWHGAARSFFEGHLAENTGPAYLCPYVDPRWDTARIQAAFAAVAAPPIVVTQTVDEDTCDYCGGPVASGQCLLCGEPSLR